MFVRSALNYDPAANSNIAAIDDFGEDKTHQSFKDECDINNILRNFAVTGQLPDNVRVPTYGDFEDVFDFQSAMNTLRAAQESFDAMPSDVRERFNNDPNRFMEFVHDDSNYDEAVKMGLAIKKPVGVAVPPEASAADSGSKEPSGTSPT